MITTLLNDFSPENNPMLWLFGTFVLAFVIALRTFPSILFVSLKKRLMDEPGNRSMHSNRTPTLGGIGIYFSVMLVIAITGAMLNTKVLLLVMGGLTILFFLGLKDDLTALSPKKKLLGQLFAALLIIFFTDSRIIGFSSILGIEELPYWFSLLFTLFVYILIINAYNLIDGVDGLAGSVGLLISAVFAYLFYQSGELNMATVAIALIGALIAFLRYNMSPRLKIFMGDTGSMIVGFLLAFFTVSFVAQSQLDVNSEFYKVSPAIVLALLFYPLIDTCRIFFIRIFVLKSNPFAPDKNHIHHKFISIGYSHIKTTIMVCVVCLIIICIAFNLTHLDIHIQIIGLLLYGSLLYLVPFGISRAKRKSKIKENQVG